MATASAVPPRSIWLFPHPDAVVEVARRLVRLRLRTISRTLYRATPLKYLTTPSGSAPEPLYYLGSLRGRRYTPPHGPAGLYLSYDPSTPPAELRMVIFSGTALVGVDARDPVVTISVDASVRHVLVLTDDKTRKALELTDDLLHADWEEEQKAYLAGAGSMPATQLLALAAHSTGVITGIEYASSRTGFGVNLVVFPDRLDAAAGDYLQVVDASGELNQRLP